jgi:hypothetical protein
VETWRGRRLIKPVDIVKGNAARDVITIIKRKTCNKLEMKNEWS